MKRKKLFIMIFISLLILPIFSLVEVYGGGLVTERYDVNIEVHEDYSWNVEEIINMNFLEEHHGIFRYIPVRGKVYYKYEDKEYEKVYRLKFEDIEIPDYKFEKYYENDNIIFKIGDGDIYISGLHTYNIKYKVKAFKERLEGFEQFYWNILPRDWNAPIERGKFVIEMPKAIDPKDVEFISGAYGTSNVDGVRWTIENERIIVGELIKGLEPGESVTLRVVLPEGYFQGIRNNNWMIFPFLILLIITPIININLWRRHGKDPTIVKTVEFYPPEGIDPAQASYILGGKGTTKDIVGVIIYLANEGYLTIEEEGRKFKLIKTKELPESIVGHRRTVFDGLFHNRDVADEAVLRKNFSTSAKKAIAEINKQYKKDIDKMIFSKASLKVRGKSVLISGLPFLALNTFGIGYGYGMVKDMLVATCILLVTLLSYFYILHLYDKRRTISKFKTFINRFVAFLFSATFALANVMYVEGIQGTAIWGALALASSLIALVFAVLMKQRSIYGAEMLGKTLGFKEFLKVAEVDRIERLVEDNPSYFFNTLPYAYVFGLTRVWAKKFERITMDSPKWYYGAAGATFSHHAFMRSFNRYANTLDRVSAPRGSGSGGSSGSYSSGGGSSGGGMGGGGGGGW